MPTNRRVIFSSYVVPTQSIEMEETSIRKTTFQDGPGKTLGGKGTASINAEQWGDGWVSCSQEGSSWAGNGDVWELSGEVWDGELGLTESATRLTNVGNDWDSAGGVWELEGKTFENTLKFLYIKNTGTTNKVLVSLDSGSNYYIIIPPGGSTHLRGGGTDLLCDKVFAKTSSSLSWSENNNWESIENTWSAETTTIEYILAQ